MTKKKKVVTIDTLIEEKKDQEVIQKYLTNKLDEHGEAVADIPITDFWQRVEKATVKEIEEFQGKIGMENELLAYNFNMQFRNCQEQWSKDPKLLTEKSFSNEIVALMGTYGLQLGLKYKNEICLYWKHEKMPAVFKEMAAKNKEEK